MNTPFTFVIAIGIGGFLLQWIVLRSAKAALRVRTQTWLDQAAAKRFRRQTRANAMFELERSLALTPAASTLRRLGVMAPLLGVVLTAASVMFSKASLAILVNLNEATDVLRILEAVAPLLAGVTMGALLAICNQLFLISLHRVEDRLLSEATAILEHSWFRDTDDRIETVIGQIAGLGEGLSQMLQRIMQTVDTAAAGGDRLGLAISAAAKSLDGASSGLMEAISGPSREFQSAAEEISKTAKTGLMHYKEMSESYGQLQERGFDQLADVQRQKLEALRTEAAAAQQLQNLLRSAEQLRLPEWSSNFDALARAADSLMQAMSALSESFRTRGEDSQRSLAQLTESVGSTMARIEGSLSAFDVRCRQAGEAASAASLRPEEINRVREGLRQLSDVLEASLRSLQAANSSLTVPSRPSSFPWFRSGSQQ